MFKRVNKHIRQVLIVIASELAYIFGKLICLLSIIGIAKELCMEIKANEALGEASGHYMNGNYKKCLKLLTPYLDVEDDLSGGGIKYQLALLFYYGKGVTLNHDIANGLFKEAAALGDTHAQNYLSQFNENHSK